jgi:leucyl aminopeptidase (aminopeptidase T)
LKTSSPNDALYRKVAKKVLSRSLRLKKGETLTVETWNNGLPFARQVMIEARKMGAHPLMILEDEDAYVQGVRGTPKNILGKMGKHEFKLLSASDAYVFIPGPVLGSYSHRLPREDVTASTAYGDSWYKAAAKSRLRGARLAFGYIGEDAPSILGKSVEAIVNHQLTAALADYGAIGKKARAIGSSFKAGAEATLRTPGSKLTFKLTGMKEIDDGVVDERDLDAENNVHYIAPGYVYGDIDPASVSGRYTFSPTVTRFGMIKDGTLEFSDGRLTGWKSSSSRATLGKLAAAASEGAKKATGLTVGLNPLLKYGFGQNSHTAGVVGVRALGVTFTSSRATLRVAGKALVTRGRV